MIVIYLHEFILNTEFVKMFYTVYVSHCSTYFSDPVTAC